MCTAAAAAEAEEGELIPRLRGERDKGADVGEVALPCPARPGDCTPPPLNAEHSFMGTNIIYVLFVCIVGEGYSGESCEPEAEEHVRRMHMFHGNKWDGTTRKRNGTHTEREQSSAEWSRKSAVQSGVGRDGTGRRDRIG